MARAATSTDPPGVAAWLGVASVVTTWLPSFAVFVPTMGTPLVAVGPVVSGTGGFTFASPGALMGPLLASAAGSLDPAGLAKWASIGGAIVDWIAGYGGVDPSALIGFVGPSPGAVTGVGTVAFASSDIGPALARAAGSNDATGIAKWGAIGGAILSHVTTNAVVLPGTLVNPGVGGPVTGASALS